MNLTINGTLVLLGAGKMGGALLRGWLHNGPDPAKIIVIDPAPPAEIAALIARNNIRHLSSPELDRPVNVLILALKPQMMADALPALQPHVQPDTLIVSIAAGKPVAFFEGMFGLQAKIIRAMPNSPAAVGRGITGLYARAHVGAADRKLAGGLFAAVGDSLWLEDEAMIDAVTAISGSGPAYVFYLVEALALAGESAGLAPDQADQLARATVAGAGELLHQSSESATQLRENVTSPGGTTAAAMKVLGKQHAFIELIRQAVIAARDRAVELSE